MWTVLHLQDSLSSLFVSMNKINVIYISFFTPQKVLVKTNKNCLLVFRTLTCQERLSERIMILPLYLGESMYDNWHLQNHKEDINTYSRTYESSGLDYYRDTCKEYLNNWAVLFIAT